MRKSLIPFVIVAALGTAGAALAKESNGVIKAIDPAIGTVTLADGHVYGFGTGKDAETLLRSFRVGDKVVLTWHQAGSALAGDMIAGVAS